MMRDNERLSALMDCSVAFLRRTQLEWKEMYEEIQKYAKNTVKERMKILNEKDAKEKNKKTTKKNPK